MDSYYGDGGCCIVHPESANVIITGGQGPLTETNLSFVVSHSRDNGLTWTRCNLSGLLSGYCYALAVAPSQPAIIYAGGVVETHGGVYRSTDRGVTWLATATAPADTIRSLEVLPTDPNRVFATTRSGLFASTDGGTTWADLNAGTKLYAVSLHPNGPDTIVAGGDSGVVISYDGGRHWTALNEGLETRSVLSLCFAGEDGGTLIAGTAGRGCFAWSPSSGTSEEHRADDAGYRMRYSGPTVVRGVIQVDSRQNTAYRGGAELLDITGRKVMDIPHSAFRTPHSVDVSRLSPGIYFLREDRVTASRIVIAR